MSEPSQPDSRISHGHSRLAKFDLIQNVPFWNLHGTPLGADIWVPKTAKTGSYLKLIIHYHGGGLVAGSRDATHWWSHYFIEFMEVHNALVIAPDYPLTPESESPEMVQSVRQLFSWLSEGNLKRTLDEHPVSATRQLKPEIDRLIVASESAGAWMALWAAIKFPDRITSLFLRYPMMDIESDWYNRDHTKDNLSGLAATFKDLPKKIIEDYIAKRKPGQVRLSGNQEPLAAVALMHGMTPAMLGTENAETYPIKVIERGQIIKFPLRVWLVHPEDDTITPAAESHRLALMIRSRFPDTEVRVDTPPGEHGFDISMTSDQANFPCSDGLWWIAENW